MVSKEEFLRSVVNRYVSCPDCFNNRLKPSIPIKRQMDLSNIDKNYKKCPSCNKRHINIVMAHALKYMIDNDFLSLSSSIRKVGTPLITPAIVLESSPYLPEDSLVLLTTHADKNTAQQIYDNVPEIKAIIKGDINKTVGQLNEQSPINKYELLVGCDIRCDIQNTPAGPLCLIKPQSQIHIEYPKQQSPKIIDLDNILNQYENPTVLDALCGAGTLGIYALTKNAKEVHFNDINEAAIDTTKSNLKLNGIPENQYTISNEDINKLANTIDKQFDIGLIDAFPNVDISLFKESLNKICKNVYVI